MVYFLSFVPAVREDQRTPEKHGKENSRAARNCSLPSETVALD